MNIKWNCVLNNCFTSNLVQNSISVNGSDLSSASRRSVAPGGTVREAEIVAEATALLEGLGEHLVLLDVVVRNGPGKEELRRSWQEIGK